MLHQQNLNCAQVKGYLPKRLEDGSLLEINQISRTNLVQFLANRFHQAPIPMTHLHLALQKTGSGTNDPRGTRCDQASVDRRKSSSQSLNPVASLNSPPRFMQCSASTFTFT